MRDLISGVLQGSVIGPTLWNFLYDGLLQLLTPNGVEIIAYANDIAVVARALVIFKVGESLKETAEAIVDWLAEIGIELGTSQSALFRHGKEQITPSK